MTKLWPDIKVPVKFRVDFFESIQLFWWSDRFVVLYFSFIAMFCRQSVHHIPSICLLNHLLFSLFLSTKRTKTNWWTETQTISMQLLYKIKCVKTVDDNGFSVSLNEFSWSMCWLCTNDHENEVEWNKIQNQINYTNKIDKISRLAGGGFIQCHGKLIETYFFCDQCIELWFEQISSPSMNKLKWNFLF